MWKGLLFVGGIGFIFFLLVKWLEFYGQILSFQPIFLILVLLLLAGCLFLDIFYSKIEDFIKRLPQKAIEVYFSSAIVVSVGFVGLSSIVYSIIYGSFYVAYYESEQELIKLGWQGWVWFVFMLYFIAVMLVLFILPMMNRLNRPSS